MKLVLAPEPTITDDDDELWHIVCRCMRSRPPGDQLSMCGKRLRGISPDHPVADWERCLVCLDLVKSIEPRPCCGYRRPA